MRQVLCFGDSNTYGYVPGTAERYDWDTRWTGIVGTGLMEKGYIVQEEGLCGRTTVFDDPLRLGRRGSELLPIILETHKPEDLIILMLGTNDCKTFYGATAGSIGLGIRKLVRQIRDGAPSAKILLMSPIALGEKVWDGFDPEFGKNSVQVSKELPEIYRQIAEKEGLYYLAASDYAVPSERDQEHMDEEGHKALAEAVLEKISEIL
jgi:lysophospholipase L1-like esterase